MTTLATPLAPMPSRRRAAPRRSSLSNKTNTTATARKPSPPRRTPKRSNTSTLALSKMARVINIWRDLSLRKKNSDGRIKRSNSLKLIKPQVVFREPIHPIQSDDPDAIIHDVYVDVLEFDPREAVKTISDETWVTQQHEDIPWYEQPYEELPWWEYPDLEEDDEITAHVKDVIRESSSHGSHAANYNCEKWIQGHADRVEALVVTFVLKLKHRVAFTEFQKEQERLLRTQQQEQPPEFEDVSLGGDSHDPSYAVVGGSVDSRENYGSVESDNHRRSSLQSIDEKSAQEAPLPIAATKKTSTTTNTGPIRQDEQELMRKLLNPSTPPAASSSTSTTKPKITKEDVAKMVLPRRTKKLPRRTRSGTSQQSHSVLDDDSVSLHSAVMSTGWNKLNIHNSELKRYRKNHRSFHRAAASPTARRMWADDHTVMINSGRNTNNDDDVKSVASFQSSPAMMEYSRTRQNWMQFNPHSHRKREPKRVFRLTTSATSTWLDDSASEHTNETGASADNNLHASLSSLGGGRRKKKKKKKKKVGHLAMFMAKEELRGGASESNIFDIMEEEAEERDQSPPPPQRANEPPPKKSSLGFLESSPPIEEKEEDQNLDDSNDALNFSHNENDGDDSEQPANLDDSDNCLQPQQLDDDSDNAAKSDDDSDQVHHSDDDSSAAGVQDDDSDAVVQDDDDSDAGVEAEEDSENSSHKSDGSDDKANLEDSNASLQDSQDSDDNSDNESKSSSSSSSSSSSKGSLNWKQDEEEKKETATEEVNANKKIGDSSSTLGRSSTSTSSTTDKSSSKSATAETNRPVQGGRVSDLVNKKENEKEKSDAMAEWQVAVLRMKRNSQEGPIQRTSVANRAAAFEKNNGNNEKKPLTSPPPARITPQPPPRITPTIAHDKKPIPVQSRIAPLASKVDSKPVPVQPRIAPLPSKADSKEPPFRQRATRRASGSGISLFSMRLPESGPRTASTMTPTESSRGSKAKEESITDASSNKRPPSPPPKKTKPKHKPFITRRASFSDIQVRVDSDLFGDKKPRKTSMNDDDPKMRLVMLRHAAMCTQTQRGAVCPSDPKCSQMKELLRHMMGCKHQSTMVPCNFPGCHESKEFLIMMHKTSQILAQQRDAQKDLPPMVCIPTSTSKVGEKSEDEAGDDGDDLSDIGSFGSAGGGMDDKDDHDDDDDSDKQEKKTATMESSAHRRSLSPKPTGQRRTTWAPTTSPTRPKPVLKDPVLIEKMKKEEEEKEKIQADLKKRHEAVKARVQAKLQNAQAQKRELDAAKFIRDAENRTRSQALIMQQRRSERSNAETDTPLMQRRKSEKTMEAEKSAPVLRRRSEMPVSSTTQQNAVPPRRITPTPEDEKRLKEQEELRRKHAELKAKMDKAKVERAEKEAVRAMGKIKPVRGMSLPTNPGRMGYVDRSSLRAAAPTSPVRTPAPTSTKVLPTNTGRGRRAVPAAPPTTKTSPKAAPKKTASPPKVIERVDKETGRKKLASEVVYENQIEATSAVARLKAAKLAKKAKKSKKGSDV